MDNFAVVSEIFINEAGESSVISLVYPDVEEGKSAFYDKAKYVPIFKDKGYKAVVIMDKTMQNILPPVVKEN